MTLSQRLLSAIGLVLITATVALGLSVREAWRRTEEDRFKEQFDITVTRLTTELGREIEELGALLSRRCEHEPVIDSVLVDMRAGRFDTGRRLAVSLQIRELMKALSLDELLLITGDGEILGAGHSDGLVGSSDSSLGKRLTRARPGARLRTSPAPLALEAHCLRTDEGVTLALYGARYFASLLEEVGKSHGLSLTVGNAGDTTGKMVERVRLHELGGATVVATRSRLPLQRALRSLDVTIIGLGAMTVLAALLLAFVLARGLSRPIVELSRQAQQVVAGEPKPVRGRGGRELEELADSFNRAIRDLTALRKRLAATERIAARREIARRVAHEIKNPLAPIRAAVETLRRLRARGDTAFDDYFDEATRTVLDEVARITHIVQEFTRFARLPPPTVASMDLVQAARDVVRLQEASGRTIHLVAPREAVIQADRNQMVQVMTNLLQNALEATEGQADARVEIEIDMPDDETVHMSVRDNGPGVPSEIEPKLFEPYATSKEYGTGLGLAIVQRIVVEHGGDIRYRRAPGGGAELAVTLPVAGPTLPPEPPPSSSRRGRSEG